MKLTIDNLDGAGVRDYTGWIETSANNKIQRKLNQATRLEVHLVAESPEMVVPAPGARILVMRNDGHKLFTGYIGGAPQYEFLGWGQLGPAFRYKIVALSDEVALDRKRLPTRSTFIAQAAGKILKQLVADTGVSGLDTSAVADIETLPQFSSSPQLPWSEHARQIAVRTRSVFRAHDGAISLQPVGVNSLVLDEEDLDFIPNGLALECDDKLVNDLTVLGRVEPRSYVKDYFIGDGLTLGFNLSHSPFSKRTSTLLEEEFSGSALSAVRWSSLDPTESLSVSAGKLEMQGGTGLDGQTTVKFTELLELSGSLNLQHGELEVSAGSEGVIGGLYSGVSIQRANCVTGFSISPAGAQATIRALINGVETGPTINTIAGRRYLLSTRIYASEAYRAGQKFHSSVFAAANPRGGAAVDSSARLVLDVHEIDPANPGSLGAPSTVLYDAVLTTIPGYCSYALVNAVSIHASLSFTRILRQADAEVRSTIPAQPTRTRLVGSIAEGAECIVSQYGSLQFFSPYVPVSNETIVVRYRSGGRAIARKVDAASIAAAARPADDGVRAKVRKVIAPAARTSTDCGQAALALLDDSVQPAWSGQYECWSDFLPEASASDPLPGDAVSVIAPSRNADFTATLRQVEIALKHWQADRNIYKLQFANDAADPLAFEFEPGIFRDNLEANSPDAESIASLSEAEISSITSTTVGVNAGVAPGVGGGIEVRRSDFAWGAENDRNLIARFTTQSFNLPRLARIQTYYLRQFDGATPRRYSQHSTALHINYPF